MTIDHSEWENLYQQGQTGWDRGETSANLMYWIESGILESSRVLIPGCGNGHEVLSLAERGFEVVAVDIAPSPIENLKKALKERNLKAELVQANFFEWHPDQLFDEIYEQTSLCALPPALWEGYEGCLYDWLKPNGKLLAQFMQTGQEGGPPYHCKIGDMRELFTSERWKWSEQHETQAAHSSDKTEELYLLEKVG